MVEAVKSIAALNGAVCYADPFLPSTDDKVKESVLTRAIGWVSVPSRRQTSQLALDRAQREPPMLAYGIAEARGE
jgi:hypothetical protein